MNWGDLAVRADGLATHLLDEPALAEVEAATDAAALAAALGRAGWGPTAGAGPDRQLDQDAIRNGFASVVNPGRL